MFLQIVKSVSNHTKFQGNSADLPHMLTNTPDIFLANFRSLLSSESFEYFKGLNNPEVDFILNCIMHSKQTNRNIRYNHFLKNPQSFSLENLKNQYPIQYYEHVGRFEGDQKSPFAVSMSLVDRIYHDVDLEIQSDIINEYKKNIQEFDDDEMEDINDTLESGIPMESRIKEFQEICKELFISGSGEFERLDLKSELEEQDIEDDYFK